MSEGMPEGWEVKKLGSFLKLTSGKSKPQKQQSKYNCKNQIPVFGGNGITGYCEIPLLTNKTIIIGRVGEYCGCIHSSSDLVWVTDNALYIKSIKAEHNINFIFYLLVFSRIDRLRNKSGQPLVSQEPIYDLVVNIPPLPEQKKIAKILTSVDEVIETTENQINKLKELKKGMMNELLTKGIGHTEFKDSAVGMIPVEWKSCKLGEICKFTQGTQVSATDMVRYHEKGYVRYLYIRDFTRDDKLWYVEDIYPQKYVSINDIVMANTGHTSGTVYKGKHGVLSNNAFKISFNLNTLDTNFLYLFLQSDFFCNKIKQLFNSAGQPHVGHGNIAKMPMVLPAITEQQNIANTLTSINNNIEQKQTKLTQTKNLKKSLMADLLTGRVRVKP